jgi:hypothetical protein
LQTESTDTHLVDIGPFRKFSLVHWPLNKCESRAVNAPCNTAQLPRDTAAVRDQDHVAGFCESSDVQDRGACYTVLVEIDELPVMALIVVRTRNATGHGVDCRAHVERDQLWIVVRTWNATSYGVGRRADAERDTHAALDHCGLRGVVLQSRQTQPMSSCGLVPFASCARQRWFDGSSVMCA